MLRVFAATALLWLVVTPTAAAAGVVGAPTAEPLQSLFAEGGHYTAELSQVRQSWRLLPADGDDLLVQAQHDDCGATHSLPTGIWLLTRDGEGRPALLAPSSTVLPDGHPELVAIRACGVADNGQPQLVAPKALIDWLLASTGAIHVAD